jgi:hypothetical protein
LTHFISKQFDKSIASKSKLVLSPEFYWAKRVELDVRFVYEVKKMAVSIFDGVLPSGDFEYMVFKLGKGDFLLVAYSISWIKSELEKLGIDMVFVDKIYLLESLLAGKDVSLRVDDDFGIVSEQRVLTYAPLRLLGDSVDIEGVLSGRRVLKEPIYSKQFQNIRIGSKQLNYLILMALFLCMIVLFETIKLASDSRNILEQKQSFIEQNSLPQTSFQIKSMQDELQIKEITQNDLRGGIDHLSRFELSQTEFFEELEFSNKKLSYQVKLDNQKRQSEIKEHVLSLKDSTVVVVKR